jgi:hypothetical protein
MLQSFDTAWQSFEVDWRSTEQRRLSRRNESDSQRQFSVPALFVHRDHQPFRQTFVLPTRTLDRSEGAPLARLRPIRSSKYTGSICQPKHNAAPAAAADPSHCADAAGRSLVVTGRRKRRADRGATNASVVRLWSIANREQ